jgi:hypothetical protein
MLGTGTGGHTSEWVTKIVTEGGCDFAPTEVLGKKELLRGQDRRLVVLLQHCVLARLDARPVNFCESR